MLKNDICITGIGQAVIEIFPFKMGIPRKNQRIRISHKKWRTIKVEMSLVIFL